MDLLYFILSAYGLTQILIYGSIFNKIRPTQDWLKGFGKIFHCPMCMGFWTGLLLFGINRYTELFTFEYTFANALVLGWLSSGTCYLIGMLVNDFGFKTVVAYSYENAHASYEEGVEHEEGGCCGDD